MKGDPTSVAIIARLDNENIRRAVLVPYGEWPDLDEGGRRPWLWPYLGTEWHLIEILKVKDTDLNG